MAAKHASLSSMLRGGGPASSSVGTAAASATAARIAASNGTSRSAPADPAGWSSITLPACLHSREKSRAVSAHRERSSTSAELSLTTPLGPVRSVPGSGGRHFAACSCENRSPACCSALIIIRLVLTSAAVGATALITPTLNDSGPGVPSSAAPTDAAVSARMAPTTSSLLLTSISVPSAPIRTIVSPTRKPASSAGVPSAVYETVPLSAILTPQPLELCGTR